MGVISAALAQCMTRAENVKVKEAAAIHQAMMAQYDSLRAVLEARKERVQAKLDEVGDAHVDYPAYKSMYSSLNRGQELLDSWRASVVAVPGVDTQAGAAADAEATQLSDAELLELQQALDAKLDEVGGKIDELVVTMDMYLKDEKQASQK